MSANDQQGLKEEEEEELCDRVKVYQNRTLTQHGHVFEGKYATKTGNDEWIPCAVKFPREASQYNREINSLNSIGRYKHIVNLLHSDIKRGKLLHHPYIIFERCHDLNLHQLVMHRGVNVPVYDVNWAFDICKQIISGVTFIHDVLIVHKDLKPSNILLTHDLNCVKVADLGSSQMLSNAGAADFCPDMFGTTGYRPPESYGNSHVSLKSDVFSLGAVFFFILTNGNSPFGGEADLWDYNAKNGIMTMLGLQVPNKRTTVHLITSMLQRKRNRRPTMWQVGSHPCLGGSEVDFEFDYTSKESVELMRPGRVSEPEQYDDAAFIEVASLPSSPGDGQVSPLPLFAGALNPITLEKTILICNKHDSALHRLHPSALLLSRFQHYNADMKTNFFTAVAHPDNIYVLTHNKSVYRLACGGTANGWTKMSDMIVSHGQYPPAVSNGEFIYVVARSEGRLSRASTKFNPSSNTWVRLEDKALPTDASSILSMNDYIYCIGGLCDEPRIATDKVDRLDVISGKWRSVAPLRMGRFQSAVTQWKNHILIFGGKDSGGRKLNTVEEYNPQNQQWTELQPMVNPRWGPRFKCHKIDGIIYAVGGDGVVFGETIEKYDPTKKESSILANNEWKLEIWGSVTVNLSQ